MLLTAVLFAGVFSVWTAILYFQLRHAGLTALVLVAPLPFVIGAALVVAFADNYALFSYLLGVVIAQTIAVRVARGICNGHLPSAGISQAIRGNVKVAGPIMLGFVGWILAANLHPFGIENFAGTAALFVPLIGTPVVMLLARWLPYSELFIARVNKAREARERLVGRFQFITETRWAFSISGVALIFFVLSTLGMRALQIEEGALLPERLAFLAAFVFACAIALTRNWRLATAITGTLSLLCAIGLWIFARGILPLPQQMLLTIAFLLAIAAMPSANVAIAINVYIRAGDEATIAIARGYQDECANAFLSAVMFAVPWIALGFIGGGTTRLELAISIASLFAAPLIFPAFAGAIYAIFPRYRTVDEVFGKR